MVREHGPEHPSQWAAIQAIASKLGCTARLAAARLSMRDRLSCHRATRDAMRHKRASGCRVGNLLYGFSVGSRGSATAAIRCTTAFQPTCRMEARRKLSAQPKAPPMLFGPWAIL